jgi:hypothetical protein
MSVKDLTFFVDLDGTLKTEAGATPPFEVDTVVVESGIKRYEIGIRPHIKEFLEFAKSRGKVVLSTASGRRYARKMLIAMEIHHYFDDVISAESFQRGIPYYSNCIFIDNCEDTGIKKMDKMASRSHNAFSSYQTERNDLWTIDTYDGSKEDTTMLELIEEIKAL